jgi:hypothetical protein
LVDNDAAPPSEVDPRAAVADAVGETATGSDGRQAPERAGSARAAERTSPRVRREDDSPAARPTSPEPAPQLAARPSLRTAQSAPPPPTPPAENPSGPPGTLNIRSIQPAVVTINGERRGQTPLEGLQLAPGSYRIELSNPSAGVDRSYRIEIESGRTRTIINSGP